MAEDNLDDEALTLRALIKSNAIYEIKSLPFVMKIRWHRISQAFQGEEIPLSARIFAVVDVWDALTSDRPYRKAWSREEATQYIKDLSRKHFDPHVVNVFLNMVAPI